MRIIGLILFILIASCSTEPNQQPRPRQYPRISFPTKEYQSYSYVACPFAIDIPAYSNVIQKKRFFEEVLDNPCWFDVVMEDFNATIHCSYYEISEDYSFDKLVNDAYTMASKHNVKASFREEFIVENQRGAKGMIFKINGPVATPYQFYMSDSTNHFLRGSLYFNDRVDTDSIAPVVAFIEKDIERLLESLDWN